MPSYFFDLITETGLVRDSDGTDLADDAAAFEHARLVILELMQGREAETQEWHLDVYDVMRRRCMDLPFGDVRTLSPFFAGARERLSSLCEVDTAIAGSWS